MRWLVCGLLIAMACPALGADYDDSWLRGSQDIGAVPPPPPRLYRIWAGVYGGLQVGEDFHNVDFVNLPGAEIASATRQNAVINILSGSVGGMATLPTINTKGPSYGGFLGYNWQIDDIVFGAELNANRSSFSTAANNSVTRRYYVILPDIGTYATRVNVITDGTADMSDYFTLRGRVGWAFGNFLPYLVAGVSFAQIDTTGNVNINYFGTNIIHHGIPPHIAGNYPFSNISHGKYVVGFDAALGMDYLLTKNVFARRS